MLKRTTFALALAAMMLPAGAVAQEQATLTLRSGEKVTGQLVDHGAAGFEIQASGQNRTIPTSQVAVIDFGGSGDVSAEDLAKVTGGSHTVWLKNGQTFNGHLHDIGGKSPLRLTFKTDAGERNVSSNEVSRVVLARPEGAAATTGSAQGSGQAPAGEGIAVAGNQAWTPTGLTVRRGEVITFNTTGEVRLSADAADVAGPAGARSQRKAAGAPLAGNLAGALIGRVGNGEPFPIGDQTSVTMPAAGQLFLGINDDDVNDNQGGFRVKVTRSGRRQ